MEHRTERVAYFDCFSGASGDMLLGALIDAGLELGDVKKDLAALDLHGYELEVVREVRRGLSGSRFVVHDLGGEHPARHLSVVRELIARSALPEEVKAASYKVFERLAQAEATIHGVDIEAVHFHEVGAVDAVVDIVGFCCAIHRMGLQRLYVSPLPLGSGTIVTEHGLLPVPAPATLALLAEVGAPTCPSPGPGELVTPTGAALLTTLAEFAQPCMRVRAVGYGFGTKEFPWANALRVWVADGKVDGSKAMKPHTHGDGIPHTHEHDHAHPHAHSHDHAHPHTHSHDEPHTHEHAEDPKHGGHEHHDDSHSHDCEGRE